MATIHKLSVITNNCYKPPVNPESGLSSSLNERTTLGVTSGQYAGDSDEESDRENKHFFGVDNVNNSLGLSGTRGSSIHVFNQTDSYVGNLTTDLAGLDDSEFYKRLTELKNEHKKTLEMCEKMYQEKVGEAYSSTNTSPQGKGLGMSRSMELSPGRGSTQEEAKNWKNASARRMRDEIVARSNDAAIELHPDVKLDASYGKPPIAPTSHNRSFSATNTTKQQNLRKSYEDPPRSARSIASAWTDRSDGEDRFWQAMSGYSSEADQGHGGHNADETFRKSYNANDYLNSARSSAADGVHNEKKGRNSALSHIENMWDKFSIDEYAPRRSSLRQRSNSMSRLSRSSSFDRRPDRPLSATSTEWRNRITVPKPFKMTVRESMKERTRSRNMEEFEREERERRKREEEECQKKFKATPVPAHVYMPLYDDIMTKKEEQRQQTREASMELTKSMEKPFKFVKREEEKQRNSQSNVYRSKAATTKFDKGPKKLFKAKPYPAHLFNNSTEDKMLEEEEYRKIRVQMRAEDMLRKSQLPPNMASKGKDYVEGRYRQKQRVEKAKKSKFNNDFKFQPKINDEVPDFEELHRGFHNEMSKRKDAKEATVCKPFKLKTDQVVRKKHKQYEDFLQEEATLKETRWPYQSLRGNATLNSSLGASTLSNSLDSFPTKMTASAELRSSASKKKMQESMERELKELEEERTRRLKERRLKKLVAQKAAANDTTPSLKETNQLKIKEFKASERARLVEYRRQLNEMKDRVQQRPLLFERTSQENAARTAERRYQDTIKRAGLDEEFIAKKGSRAASHHDNDTASDAESDSYPTYSKQLQGSQSESHRSERSKSGSNRSESKNRYSEDFDDGSSDGDKTQDNSDIDEDLPADN